LLAKKLNLLAKNSRYSQVTRRWIAEKPVPNITQLCNNATEVDIIDETDNRQNEPYGIDNKLNEKKGEFLI
jgi:hypothetical protein